MCTYRTAFPVPSVNPEVMNPEVERVRIRSGKDVFAKLPSPGSVFRVCTEEGVESAVWIEEIDLTTNGIVFREVVLENDPDTPWIEKRHDMLISSLEDRFWECQVNLIGTMSPAVWPEFVSELEIFDRHRRWTIEFRMRALAFCRNFDAVTERGARPAKASLATGCQPVTEQPSGGPRDVCGF